MSIRTRILLACLSLTAVTLAFGAVTGSAQHQLGNMTVGLYDDAFMSMSYLRSAQNKLLSISRDVAVANLGGDMVDRINDAADDSDVAARRALSPEGRQAASRLRDQLAAMGRTLQQTGVAPQRQYLSELEQRFDTAVEINAGDGFRYRRATGELVSRLSAQTWAAMAASVAAALAITLLLSRSIVPALRHAVSIATAIAAGRLDNRIEARGSGETSVLLRALSVMQGSIGDKIARIEQLMAEQASMYADELASQHQRFETALDNMAQGLCMFDNEGRVLVHNRRFAEMFAPARPGTPAEDAVPAVLLADNSTAAALEQTRGFTRTLDDGRTLAVADKPMPGGGSVTTYEDVTERYRSEARIAYLARHDALTGLPNRVLYHEHMEHALAQVRRGHGGLGVLYLNLDHFKAVNDTLGHSVGDGLLHAVAQRLLRETREMDIVVRLGGDEFAVIQPISNQPVAAQNLAERLLASIAEPFQLGDHQIPVSLSIGIAVTSDGSVNGEMLLKSADLALSRAKADGRGVYRFFEAKMDALLQARRLLEMDLRRAIIEHQFENFYQPLVSTSTREIMGFEALVRWRHPARGLVSPAEFIPVAEETELITQIGMQVLEQACADAIAWPHHMRVAVNFSPLQFKNKGLAEDVKRVLARTGLPSSRLELEITESLLLQDSESTLAILHQMQALGVHISMDDFGTGYSSLSYLRRFPFNKIKIDQSFVRSLDDKGDCIAIIRAVLGLGRSLGMNVIAEGVETEEQLALLAREGCEQVQGYLFSKPKPIAALQDMLAKCAAHASEPCGALL